MLKISKLYLVIPCTLVSFPVWAAPSAQEIMKKNEDSIRLETVEAKAVLITGVHGGESKKKEFTWSKKLSRDGKNYSTLTRFLTPAEVRGEAILFLEHESDANEILLYLPAFKKTRRVESSQQSSSFMGSEFSYSDIATPHLSDFKYILLKSENCGGTQTKFQCFVVESTPISSEVKERVGYSKIVHWIRQDQYTTAKTETYDPDGKIFKNVSVEEIQKVDAKHFLITHLKVINQKSHKFTELRFSSFKAGIDIPDSTFTQQNLSKTQ